MSTEPEQAAPPVEAYPNAAAILRDAGWKPHDRWGVYTRDTLVMGFSPDGRHFDVKNWALDVHGPDYPDDPVEAAQWLVNLRKPAAPPPEPEQTPSHEGDGETGEAVGAEEGATADLSDGAGELSADDPLDADFWDTPRNELDAAELGEEILEEHPEEFGTGPQFIFGDNLDQMRTAAIGLVMRYARSLMPAWEVTDDARLVELRNFVMGVSESRWPDDAAKQQELAGLEATLSRIGAIVKTRDAKVEFLETATREAIEAFVPEAGWP